MKNFKYKKNNRISKHLVSIFIAVILSMTAFPYDAQAAPRKPLPLVIKNLPPGSQQVVHKKNHYFCHKGKFYRHSKSGYISILPPIGVIVTGLPVSVATILVGGMTYYVYEDVYYRKIPSGYQVVEIPKIVEVKKNSVQTMDAIVPQTQIMVTAKILNVRTGPGLNHPVKSRVYYGDLLTVQGNAPDWSYVLLPDESYGWVMLKFVSVTATFPEG